MQQYVSDIPTQKLRQYNERVLHSEAGGCGSTTRRPRRPRNEDIFDGSVGNPLRFVAIIRAPWLNSVSQCIDKLIPVVSRVLSTGVRLSLHWMSGVRLQPAIALETEIYSGIVYRTSSAVWQLQEWKASFRLSMTSDYRVMEWCKVEIQL